MAKDYKKTLGLEESPEILQPTANDPQEPVPLVEVKVDGLYWVNWNRTPAVYEIALIALGQVHELSGSRRCIPVNRVPGTAIGPIAIQPK